MPDVSRHERCTASESYGGDAQIGFGQSATSLLEFGSQRLWIDRVDHLSRAEVWLEVVAGDLAAAGARLVAADVPRCDAVEPLPDGFHGYWIVNPADVVHLVAATDDAS